VGFLYLTGAYKLDKIMKKAAIIITCFVLFVVIALAVGGSSKSGEFAKSPQVVEAEKRVAAKEAALREAENTPEGQFESGLRSLVQKTGTTEMSYSSSEIHKGDKSVVVHVPVSSFWDKDALVRDTGKMSAAIFQKVFFSALLAPASGYLVSIWYEGEISNAYGQSRKEAILTYTISSGTFSEIAWSNIDGGDLCARLKQINSQDVEVNCVQLANIK
jgi:hypothetical protein